MLKRIQEICNGIEYSRHIPDEAEALAKDNNIVVIVGGSDDLMYCYGAKSYLTNYPEHSAGWDGEDLTKSTDIFLQLEAEQLGLKIFWCGSIQDTEETIKDYDTDKSGAFSYQVAENIKHLEFKVMEDKYVYCTGIIIQLPDDFKSAVSVNHKHPPLSE